MKFELHQTTFDSYVINLIMPDLKKFIDFL